MKTLSTIIIAFFVCVLWFSCSKNSTNFSEPSLKLPEIPFDYENPENSTSFATSEVTNNGATLGRVLFYDKNLSITKNVSCSSCHHQSKAFSDVTAKSVGFKGASTKRNSLPIFNTRYSRTFFWDSRETKLEELAGLPIADHIEMGFDDDDALVARLEKVSYYSELFSKAFGDEEITMVRVKSALAQFVRSISSFDSKFDRSREGDEVLSIVESDGLSIIRDRGCTNCHGIRSRSVRNSANIGLEMNYDDKGIYEITNEVEDKGKFKVPSLKNIALTAPYMHDGRFATLNEVLDHYSAEIVNHTNLDLRLKAGSDFDYWGGVTVDPNAKPAKFNFSEYDKKAIIAFLNTLTDKSMIADEKYSDPFVR